MQVVILCGGQGTRLREETEFRPKPLVEIGGRPILWHIMKGYAHYGFTNFVLCLGYRGNMIKDYFLNYDTVATDFTISLGRQRQLTYHNQHGEQDYQVTLVDTGLESMTGARIKRVAPFLRDDVFAATYGDGVSDVNIAALLEFHRAHGRKATVTAVRPNSRYGVLALGSEGRVVEFCEKPQSDGWVNAGFFIFNREVLDYFSADPACTLEREPLERLAAEGELVAYRHQGFFFSMDTYREFVRLNELYRAGDAPWAVWSMGGEQVLKAA